MHRDSIQFHINFNSIQSVINNCFDSNADPTADGQTSDYSQLYLIIFDAFQKC